MTRGDGLDDTEQGTISQRVHCGDELDDASHASNKKHGDSLASFVIRW